MAALEYDPVRKVFVAWAGGRETAYLNGKTMLWRRLSNKTSTTAPINATRQRLYGLWSDLRALAICAQVRHFHRIQRSPRKCVGLEACGTG